MIPKIIHYCWLSGDKYPRLVNKCIKSWYKLLPDYEIRLWDAQSFDFDSVPFVKQAFERRKYAFVSDYIRLYALYHFGGVYLDSDVMCYRRFDDWHNFNFFTGIETRTPEHVRFWIEAAIMGASPGNLMIKECMAYYETKPFVKSDGALDCTPCPNVVTPIFMKHYGWVPAEGKSVLPGGVVVFGADEITSSQYPLQPTVTLYHCNNCSWIPTEPWRSPLYKFCRKHDLMHIYHAMEKLNWRNKKKKQSNM